MFQVPRSAATFVWLSTALSVFFPGILFSATPGHMRGPRIVADPVATVKQETKQVAVRLTVRIEGTRFTGQVNWALDTDYGKFNTDGFSFGAVDSEYTFDHQYSEVDITTHGLKTITIRVYVSDGDSKDEKKIQVKLKN